MPEEDKEKDKPKTFTQEEVDRIVGDRLKRETAKYSDYDEAKAKAAKADAADEKAKTENQKLLDRIDAAERKALDAERRSGEVEAEALRFRVAAAKGLNPAQAKRLSGTTQEELEADADELLETFKPAKADDDGDRRSQSGGPMRRPTENLRGGGAPDDRPVETNPAKLAESVPRM